MFTLPLSVVALVFVLRRLWEGSFVERALAFCGARKSQIVFPNNSRQSRNSAMRYSSPLSTLGKRNVNSECGILLSTSTQSQVFRLWL